jgi:hypothetical protein
MLTLEQVARDSLVVVSHEWSNVDHIRNRVSTARARFGNTLRIRGSDAELRCIPSCAEGATAISASVATPSLEVGLLRQIALDLPDRAFNVVHHLERSSSKAAEALLAMVCPPTSSSRSGEPGYNTSRRVSRRKRRLFRRRTFCLHSRLSPRALQAEKFQAPAEAGANATSTGRASSSTHRVTDQQGYSQ